MEIVPNRRRTPLILVAGLQADTVERVAHSLVVAGTTLVTYDLDEMASGRVSRTLRSVDNEGAESSCTTSITLEHGCLSCTMRLDLLPLLRRLHRRSSVASIVLALDTSMEPEAVSWAIEHVVVADMPGFVDGPAALDVSVHATLACLDESDWLESATGDITVTEAGITDLDDDRTVAQLAVGQVAFADALVVTAADAGARDAWESARLMAVLGRLAPRAPIMLEVAERRITPLTAARLLAAIPAGARRGRVDGPYDPLLRGQPPLNSECGVTLLEFHADRPFHPARLHEAIDALLDGVVCARGRMWLATRPDDMLWLESAGGALRVADGDRWLAAMDADELDGIDPERRALAALRWDADHGDRHTSMVILAHRADPPHIQEALRNACLTDSEMADGQDLWMAYPDPFGVLHHDPCDDLDVDAEGGLTRTENNTDPDR